MISDEAVDGDEEVQARVVPQWPTETMLDIFAGERAAFISGVAAKVDLADGQVVSGTPVLVSTFKGLPQKQERRGFFQGVPIAGFVMYTPVTPARLRLIITFSRVVSAGLLTPGPSRPIGFYGTEQRLTFLDGFFRVCS